MTTPAMPIPHGSAWFMLPTRLAELEAMAIAPASMARRPSGEDEELPVDVGTDGVAILSIKGPMMRGPSWFHRMIGFVGYEDIIKAADIVERDASVSSVVLHIDSPGGAVNGAMDARDALARMSASKPTVAFTPGDMCSGGYLLATAANERYTARDGEVGSIGVIWSLVDWSRALENEGVKFVHLAKPAGKAKLRMGRAITDEDTEDLKRMNDIVYDEFSALVCEATGLSAEAVFKLDAGVFRGQDAVTAGLVNGVSTLSQATERAAALAAAKQPQRKTTMAAVTISKKSPPANTPQVTANVNGVEVPVEVTASPEPVATPAVVKAPSAAEVLASIEAAIPAELPGREALVIDCIRNARDAGAAQTSALTAAMGVIKDRDKTIAELQGRIASAAKAGTIAITQEGMPGGRPEGANADTQAGSAAFVSAVHDQMKKGARKDKAIAQVAAKQPELLKAWQDSGSPAISKPE